MLLTAKPYIAVIQGAEKLAKTEILLSCMFLSDSEEIIKRSHITSDTVKINQCDEENYKEENICNALMRTFSVTDRGLTKSRNLAISKSQADICIICDDDEIFNEGYEKAVLRAYDALPDADIIIFDMVDRPLKWGDSIKKLSYIDLMSVSSWQITFRRVKLLASGVLFDENMGAGAGNGAEEEFRFLTQCRKAKLRIYHNPFRLASVAQTQSTWCKGFDEEFFVNRGNTTRYIMGLPLSVLYAAYYAFAKRKQLSGMSMLRAFSYTVKGIKENRLTKLKKGIKKWKRYSDL